MRHHTRPSTRRHSSRSTHPGFSRNGRPQKRSNRSGKTIDKQRFINKATAVKPVEAEAPKHRFTDFGFESALEKRITARGYDMPTPIQDKTIKPLLEGRDVIGLASTGTGKTAAFILPIINRLIREPQRNSVLIITPTRELAHQVNDEFRSFSEGMKLFSAVCVGGESIHRQKNSLRRGVNVIVGTPGRLKDLLQQGELKLGKIHTLVLDEADQMLDMGFLPDMRFIMDKLPEDRQLACFSATMNQAVKRLLAGMQDEAVTISTAAEVTSEHIDQNVIVARGKQEKIEELLSLLKHEDYDKVLIFGETKFGVQRLAEDLSRQGHKAHAIHGNKTQSQRQRTLAAFKSEDTSVLVATDVAARGLDIPNVHLVVNFDQPQTYDIYVHRIGRTGRAGQGGTARTFVSA